MTIGSVLFQIRMHPHCLLNCGISLFYLDSGVYDENVSMFNTWSGDGPLALREPLGEKPSVQIQQHKLSTMVIQTLRTLILR